MNGDEITEYIQTSGIDFDDDSESTKVKVLDYGFSIQPAETRCDYPEVVLTETNHPLPTSAARTCTSTVSAPNCLISFINALCPNMAEDILTM